MKYFYRYPLFKSNIWRQVATAVQHLVTLQTQLTSEAGSGDLARLGAVRMMIMIDMFMMIMKMIDTFMMIMMMMTRCGPCCWSSTCGSPGVSTAC